MIVSFKNKATEDVFDGTKSAVARRALPQKLWVAAQKKMQLLNHAKELGDLKAPPSNRLKKLYGDRVGQHSIRINRQHRICFSWTEDGPKEVEIVDYH